MLALQRTLLVHHPGAKIRGLFINLSCHDGRYCPAVDHQSVLLMKHCRQSNLTPADAAAAKHNLTLLPAIFLEGLNENVLKRTQN